MTDEEHECLPDFCIGGREILGCYNEALYCSFHAGPDEKALKEALWQCFHHMELEDLVKQFDKIDGNDHPVFQKLAENIIRRYEND